MWLLSDDVTILGMDLILAELVEKGLKAANLSTRVKTGRSMY